MKQHGDPKKGLEGRLLRALALSLVTASSVFLAPPITALYGNAREFSVPIGTLLGPLILPGTVFFLALLAICLVLPEGVFRISTSILFAVCLLLYVQGNWLIGDYGHMDGTSIDSNQFLELGFFEILLWLGLPVAAIFLSKRIAPRMLPISAVMLSFVFVTPLVAAFQVAQSGGDFAARWASRTGEMQSKQAWAEEMWQFSSGENVVFILLDSFESTDLDVIFGDSPDLRKRFRGFTYYRNTLGSFPTTYMSIPALLTGEVYGNRRTIRDYLEETLRGRGLPDWFADRGYRSSVLTRRIYCEYFTKSSCFSWSEYAHSDPDAFARSQTLRLLDLALFRYGPHFAKLWIYLDHSWLLQRTFNADPPGRLSQWQSIGIADDIAERARVGSSEPVFKFIHLDVPHPPFTRDASCRYIPPGRLANTVAETEAMILAHSRCGLGMAISIVEGLEELNILDDATVVVLSDHGQRFITGRAKPVLLIKPRNSRAGLRISDAPAALTDIPKSIAELLGFANDFPGRAIQTLDSRAKRVRHYSDYVWKHRFYQSDHLPMMTHYDLRGHVSSLRLQRTKTKKSQ